MDFQNLTATTTVRRISLYSNAAFGKKRFGKNYSYRISSISMISKNKKQNPPY